jgi:multiple antibiotic resistance protein
MMFWSKVLSLFLVMNAFGNLPLFVGLLARYDMKRQRQIILRELLIALFILLLFNFFGDAILQLLGISQPIIGIAGGILLFIIALTMIFPKERTTEAPLREPFIVPFAVPLIGGPGSITAVMIFAEHMHNPWLMSGVIVAAWFLTLVVLLAGSNIKYLLGEKGLTACERLGGMLICLFAVQMFTSSAIALLKDACVIGTPPKESVAPAVPEQAPLPQ